MDTLLLISESQFFQMSICEYRTLSDARGRSGMSKVAKMKQIKKEGSRIKWDCEKTMGVKHVENYLAGENS